MKITRQIKRDFDVTLAAFFFFIFLNYALWGGPDGNKFIAVPLRLVAIIYAFWFILDRNKFYLRWLFIGCVSIVWAVVSCVVLSNFTSLNYIYLFIIIAFFAARKVSLEKVILAAFLATTAVLAILWLMHFAGSLQFSSYEMDGRARQSFGFYNPNAAAVAYFTACVLGYWYLRFRQISILLTVPIITPFVVALYLTGSRTGFFCLILFVIFLQIKTFSSMRWLVPWLIVILSGGSIALAMSDSYESLNVFLSFRLSYYYDFLHSMPAYIAFVGADVTGFTIDNSYIIMLYTMGLPIFLMMVAFSGARVRHVNQFGAVAYLFAMLAYGLFESVLIRVEFPATMVFYSILFAVWNTNSRQAVPLPPSTAED